jgi:hypothetical protein
VTEGSSAVDQFLDVLEHPFKAELEQREAVLRDLVTRWLIATSE